MYKLQLLRVVHFLIKLHTTKRRKDKSESKHQIERHGCVYKFPSIFVVNVCKINRDIYMKVTNCN